MAPLLLLALLGQSRGAGRTKDIDTDMLERGIAPALVVFSYRRMYSFLGPASVYIHLSVFLCRIDRHYYLSSTSAVGTILPTSVEERKSSTA